MNKPDRFCGAAMIGITLLCAAFVTLCLFWLSRLALWIWGLL